MTHLQDPIFEKLVGHPFFEARFQKPEIYFGDAMSLEKWISDGCNPIVTNNIILSNIPNRNNVINLPDSWCGVYYHPYPLTSETTLSKDYNCFMNRMDSVRQSWLYQLIRRGIFEKGYVSFNMDISRIPCYKDWNPHDAFQHQFETQCSVFKTEHEFIKSKVPYKNFIDHGDLTNVCYDSKIALVLETFFARNNIFTYTEKIFRALQIPRPWLLFGSMHAVKYLRKMGFDTLDDLIEHDCYDAIDFAIERQKILLDMLVHLIDKKFDPIRLGEAARHNQSLLEKFSLTYIDDWHKTVERATKIA